MSTKKICNVCAINHVELFGFPGIINGVSRLAIALKSLFGRLGKCGMCGHWRVIVGSAEVRDSKP